jgi:AcrR family transcriptional regulator
MIQYYFRSKRGLYTAMLQQVMTPIAERLEAMLQPGDGVELDLDALLRTFMTTIAENPWIPGLLVREVLNPDGEFRDDFIRDIAGRMAPRLEELLHRALATGKVRADLDPKLAVLSFMSLGMWPFVAMPIASRVLGVASDAEATTRLIEHTLRVFHQGTASEPDT